MAEHGITPIDLVVVNLYAFEATVAKVRKDSKITGSFVALCSRSFHFYFQGADFSTCIENIDIGGPSMLRSSAKNHASVTVVSSPLQYEELLHELRSCNGSTTLALRKRFSAAAFAHTAAYDSAISRWFSDQLGNESTVYTRTYVPDIRLKYGCNPHQNPSFVGHLAGLPLPFKVLNGTPGYINLLDAANAWQLASELKAATGLSAAASFKHVSPAGAAVAVPLSGDDISVYEVGDKPLTPTALAYLRARNADPMCSFGDFAAVSDVVDEATALLLKPEVSDGIVAPGFEPAALEILKSKKNGGFIILEATPGFTPPPMEFREVYGMFFAQKRNDVVITAETVAKNMKSGSTFSPEAIRDLMVALISIKYTQSNSVGYAIDGQMVGVGAGQQSRVDCVKLAGRKVSTWWLRHHPKVMSLKFKAGVKRQARVNARVRYIEGDMTSIEYAEWVMNFESAPEPLLESEKVDFLKTLKGVSLASDAFFPFRDSIDHAAKYGVTFVSQPGGSVADDEVIKATEEYGMSMGFNGIRLFHH
jgi:phosphoribosylaminoimidazolecarboxamide formyltransferase / IMP cyclohydrolase